MTNTHTHTKLLLLSVLGLDHPINHRKSASPDPTATDEFEHSSSFPVCRCPTGLPPISKEEMVGCCHQVSRQESEQTPGDGEGQGSLAGSSPWGLKEWGTNEELKNNSSPHPSSRLL